MAKGDSLIPPRKAGEMKAFRLYWPKPWSWLTKCSFAKRRLSESSNDYYLLLSNGLAQTDICIACKCHTAYASRSVCRDVVVQGEHLQVYVSMYVCMQVYLGPRMQWYVC